jgi:hypothetical protein
MPNRNCGPSYVSLEKEVSFSNILYRIDWVCCYDVAPSPSGDAAEMSPDPAQVQDEAREHHVVGYYGVGLADTFWSWSFGTEDPDFF